MFNDTLTNDIVSFEQLGLVVKKASYRQQCVIFYIVLWTGQNFIVDHWFCKTDWSSIKNQLVENIFILNLALFQVLIRSYKLIKGISR